jgi:hypothetical protein
LVRAPVETSIAGPAAFSACGSAAGFATVSSEAALFMILEAGAFLPGTAEVAAGFAAGRLAGAALPVDISAPPLAPAGFPSPAEGARSVAADAFMPDTSCPYIPSNPPNDSGALRLLPARLIRPMDRLHGYRDDGRARRGRHRSSNK